jgi:hypothetical protein
MQRVFIILFLLIVVIPVSNAQSSRLLDSLLSSIEGNSKYLVTTKSGKAVLQKGKASLLALAQHFQDMSPTGVYSDCRSRYLTKGEVAIILADRIEVMPYFTLTGLQNCTLAFCKDNANLIEYYLGVIRRNGIAQFQRKYQEWLVSIDRKKTYGITHSKVKAKGRNRKTNQKS